MITYRTDCVPDIATARALYAACSLGVRRPIDDDARFGAMLAHANITVTAWHGATLVGIARSLSDFGFTTYLADLAVHAWDLAASGGRALDLPDELLAHVENLVRSIPEEQLRSGPFGPAVEPPPGASETDRLMAYLGRTRA